MKCPHCSVTIHTETQRTAVLWRQRQTGYFVTSTWCPACDSSILFLDDGNYNEVGTSRLVVPNTGSRGPVSPEVPSEVSKDYIEACLVLPLSPKAAAALARRALQAVLRQQGYKAGDLATEITLVLDEADPSKSVPISLRETIDGIRNFGNFSAHPITDITSLQIIDVEPEEAEWCLEILEEMFQHYYVRPAETKKRRDALNAKLAAAGKPPAK